MQDNQKDNNPMRSKDGIQSEQTLGATLDNQKENNPYRERPI